jgi:hypothetical protein
MRTSGGLSCDDLSFLPTARRKGTTSGLTRARKWGRRISIEELRPRDVDAPHLVRPMLRTRAKTVKSMGGMKEGCRYPAAVVLQ